MSEAGEAEGSEDVPDEDAPDTEASSEPVPDEAGASPSSVFSSVLSLCAPAADAASASASRSAISLLSAAGENRIVAPLSTSPPPNGPASALSAAGATGVGAAGAGVCGVSGAAGAARASSAEEAAGGRRRSGGRRRCGRPVGLEATGRRRQAGRGHGRPDRRRRGSQMRARSSRRIPRRVLRVPGGRGVVDGELTRHLGGIRVGRLVDGQVPSAADLVPIAVHFASWCGRAPLCRGGWGRPFPMCRSARLSPLRRASPARRFLLPRPTHPNRHPVNSGRA
ncbi:hypothetical protein SBADM41S_03216 [Streptomyces badius]